MANKQKRVSAWYRWRASVRRRHRLLFPSPAEVQLIRIMGGKVIQVDLVREPINGFPLCFVVSMGDLFKRERISREVRAGAFFIDFGNDIGRGIEVDGKHWHGDIITEQRRDEYCGKYGWMLKHIKADDLYRRPAYVRHQVQRFLEK